MQNPRVLRILMFVLALLTSTNAAAWGSKAHLIIGVLAEERLTPAARAAVEKILAGADFATATTWADEMRNTEDSPEFWSRYASNWHYVNIDKGGSYSSSPKNPRGDAMMALQTFAAILLEEPVPAGPVLDGLKLYFGSLDAKPLEVKRFALRFLIHIVGDMQQPLHSGYAHDRGGNDIAVRWLGERTNLHAIWDTFLPASQTGSYMQIARRLSDRIARTPASDVRNIESADPQVWLKECQRLLERIHAQIPADVAGQNSYVTTFVPTVEAQLVKGGLRTAYVLNSIFGGWPIGNQ
jgi:nuclease S1